VIFMKNRTINTIIEDDILYIVLSRPKVHNAFNALMIDELTDIYSSVNQMDNIRVVILKGVGKSFCAGADLNWMRDISKFTHQENVDESLKLSDCFYKIYTCKKPTIAHVHGVAIGGANGLLSACDIVACEQHTVFSLSEVKIGIVPACISPYVVKRIGEYNARETMLTGNRFDGKKAKEFGLVNFSGTPHEVDEYLEKTIASLRTSGPNAISMCKELLFSLNNEWTLEEARTKTAEMIANLRQSEEGQEGMDAFLNKRPPNWIKK